MSFGRDNNAEFNVAGVVSYVPADNNYIQINFGIVRTDSDSCL